MNHDDAVIAGVGRTPVSRASDESLVTLGALACRRAVDDAGLRLDDVDAIVTYPGGAPSVHELRDALDVRLRWFDGGSEGPAQLRPLVAALLAVRAGAARCALVVRAVNRFPGTWSAAPPGGVGRDLALLDRARLSGAVGLFALWACRLMYEHDLSRRHLGTIVLAARAAGAGNPEALLRSPVDIDEYLAEPPLAEPLTRLDCDRLCAGAVAVVVVGGSDAVRAERAVSVDTWSAPLRSTGSLLHSPRQAMWDCAADLWSSTDFSPTDIGVWAIYDGFSSLAVEWLAALDVARGDALRSLLEDPAALAADGPTPLNPDGGMLAGGRLHGLNYVHEACLQLRNEAGARQVRPIPDAAVVAVGGGPIAGAAVLTHRANSYRR